MTNKLPAALCMCVLICAAAAAQLAPKPVPRMQAVPQPYDQVSFQRDGVEIARSHFSPELIRPFIFPVIGPYGRSLTRMGHPGDPYSHSHHFSVWLAFGKVNGVDFWSDHGRQARGRIIHQRLERLDDFDDMAAAVTQAAWTTNAGQVLLQERRQIFIKALPGDEWMLVIHAVLDPGKEPVVLGQDVLGPIGVRMAKSIGAHHGGGRIRNSEGGEDEEGVFRKKARWVDYSGQIDNGVFEGLTLMDHPSNPRHPAQFHVREDGWMGALLTQEMPFTIQPGKPLELRYGIYVHAGVPARADIDRHWKRFASEPLWPAIGPPKTERDCRHGDFRRYNTPRTFASQAECASFVKNQ